MQQISVTGTHNSFVNPIPATRNLTVRKSVYDLTPPEVDALRKAFAALQAISVSDNRGYQHVAGLHGLPSFFCPHGSALFLIWHRPYVLMFEQMLQAAFARLGGSSTVPLALPYWDWASSRAQREGIPLIFAQPTYVDPISGRPVPNPLFKAAISFPNPNNLTETSRNPASLAALAPLARLVQQANRRSTYDSFSPAVENPHNGLHGWVGGTMGAITTAAFDPIFWAHHCFVEKLFCDWQDRTHASIPHSIAGQSLAGFTKSTDQVWDFHALGYRYTADSANVVPSARPAMLANAVPASTHAATFDLTKVPDDFERASLAMVKTPSPEQSLEARVFFGASAPTAATVTEGNAGFAGSIYLFGHGGCTGDEGHCDVPAVPEDATLYSVLRPEHHLTPRTYTLDVTTAVRQAKTSAAGPDLPVHVLLLNFAGTELPPDSLAFETLSLDAI